LNAFFSNLNILYRHYKTSSEILRNLFKYPVDFESSEKILRTRLAKRKENFLDVLENTVFRYPLSPYKILMDRAGIGFDAVRELVDRLDIEPTLRYLHKKGIYIDILEFKGKKDVVRGKDTFRFKEKDFSNPLLTEGLGTKSGGTRSAGTAMVVPLEYIQAHNAYNVIAAHACGMSENPVIIWLPILPAGEGLFFNLRFAAMGNPPVQWFSQVDEKYIKPSIIDKVKTNGTIWIARYYGKKMPRPRFVDVRNTIEIARWMNENLKGAKGYSIVTYASSALRLILTAKKAGIGLGRTTFWLMGEPLTEKIHQEIEDYGCKAFSLYGCNELMIIGQGCANAVKPDDMHFCKDKLAVIQCTRKVEHSDTEVESFLFSTLLKSSPKIFLNTEIGDYGHIEARECGCAFGKMGFNEHIHTIRSFEKLTAEGATFVGSDLIPLIQSTLPSEFGGDATDYQFLEEADEEGIPRMYVLVSPDLGEIDEDKLKRLVFEALTAGEYSHTYSRSYWSQAGTLRVRRMNPIPTARGKIVPLQIRKGLKVGAEKNSATGAQ
jgi:hypothetical protein